MNRSIFTIANFLTAQSSPTVVSESRNKNELIYKCILCTLVFGLLAHGYAFFNSSFTHDSLNAVFADSVENAWKISLGRILKPAYQSLFRGSFAVPWMIGCLSMLWTSCSLYLIVRMFKMKAPICLILTAGILTTNLTVTLTAATYIYDLDANMFALFMAACAAYLWKNSSKLNALSVICIAVSMSLYQSYISTCIVLMITQCIMSTLHGEKPSRVITKGLTACLTLLLGALAYTALICFVRYATGISMDAGTTNSLSAMADISIKSIFIEVIKSYPGMCKILFKSWLSIFPFWFVIVSHILLLVCGVSLVCILIKNKLINIKRCLLSGALVLCMPPAILLSSILSNGASSHLLMMYALWLLYLLLILMLYHTPEHCCSKIIKVLRIISSVLILILLFGNIRTSNTLYLIKDMQHEASSSLFTRVLYRMEEHPEYEPGHTTVAFIGTSDLIAPVPGAEQYSELIGIELNLKERTVDYHYDPIRKMITYNLGTPLNVCDDESYLLLIDSEEVKQMPCYPDEGCMKTINDMFVVKLGQ